jgi:hypothetical protein
MALAAAIGHVEQRGLGFTSYGAFLAAWPAGRPMAQAELVEPSAWSCAHGVERWRSDCGCRVGGPERHQRWRAPLREALDWLAGELDLGFESLGGPLLKDPWAVRDDYVRVVLEPAARDAFLATHALHPLDAGARVRALQLLEAQRHRLLTSCAWYFDDLAGVEAVGIAPELDQGRAREILQAALVAALGRLPEAPGEATSRVLAVLALARRLGLDLDLWEAQTAFAPWWQGEGDAGGSAQTRAEAPDPARIPLAEALGFETPAGPAPARAAAP